MAAGPQATGQAALGGAVRVEELGDVDLGDLHLLFGERGIDVTQWRVTQVSGTKWGDFTCPECDHRAVGYRRLKANLAPRGEVLLPARTDGPRFKHPGTVKLRAGDKVAFIADPHCPFHDPGALAAFLAWTEQVGGIAQLVLLGDLLDLPGPSRHRSLGRMPSTQECVETAYQYLLALREGLPGVPIDWVVGNHDARINLYAVDNASDLAGLRQAGGGPEVLSLSHVLRLDELAIDLHHHEHGWEMGSLEITPTLAAWHEPPSKRQRDVIRYSVIHGHHHSQTWQTTPMLEQHNHQAGRRMIVGAGTMADFRTGMAYAKAPGWTQGWCWADLWDDLEHEISHVRYRDGQCWWPGGRLKIRARRPRSLAA